MTLSTRQERVYYFEQVRKTLRRYHDDTVKWEKDLSNTDAESMAHSIVSMHLEDLATDINDAIKAMENAR